MDATTNPRPTYSSELIDRYGRDTIERVQEDALDSGDDTVADAATAVLAGTAGMRQSNLIDNAATTLLERQGMSS